MRVTAVESTTLATVGYDEARQPVESTVRKLRLGKGF
jgi:hypothetical protein